MSDIPADKIAALIGGAVMQEVDKSTADVINALLAENDRLRAAGKCAACGHFPADCECHMPTILTTRGKELEDALRRAHDTLFELNPENYTHDEVCELNNASVEVILLLAPLLGETHGKTPEWWAARGGAA